jgi:hypothetical protein
VAVGGGVVALGSQGGGELDGGLVVAAAFADGFEAAVGVTGAGAPSVAEHAPVFAAEPGEVGGFVAVVVEGVDAGLGGGVLVGDGAVGDPGVGEGHAQAAMAEQGGDGFEAHPAVDGLGGQGVAQLVGVDVSEPRGLGDAPDDPPDAVTVQGPAVDFD